MRIRSFWVQIAGEVLAAHAEPVALKGKTLSVMCDEPAWVQQVGILSATIVPRIKEITGLRVDKIDARFGMAGKVERPRRFERRPVTMNIDPDDIARVNDPALRQALTGLLVKGEE